MSDGQAQIFLGAGETPQHLALKYANRHGLIAGATGSGKTVTLQIMAEEFSRAGVPVFLADVKGDLSGLSQAGVEKDFLTERAQTIGLSPYPFEASPVTFWDLFGKAGHPVRTTISEMGPLLLARLLGLNDTQEGVLSLAFRLADDEGLLLLDLKDLRALLVAVSDRRKELSAEYGNVSTASIGAIQRKLLQLEEQGAANFFGEPALALSDLIRRDTDGRGMINVLMADRLMTTPKLYATFLLWLLSELFEELPEVGDPERPVFAFFFDEAHLLFDDAPRALIDKLEQVVRLIRSKGVGVYFVTQNPADVPDDVSGQLGARIQHVLRGYTPKQKRAIRAAAQTFRANPAFDAEEAITQLGVGEALVSTLLKKGVPSPVERTLIRPPSSRMGPITNAERKAVIASSPLGARYQKRIDRRSAYEVLAERTEAASKEAERRDLEEKRAKAKTKSRTARAPRGRRSSGVGETVLRGVARTLTTQITRSIIRGVLGGLRR